MSHTNMFLLIINFDGLIKQEQHQQRGIHYPVEIHDQKNKLNCIQQKKTHPPQLETGDIRINSTSLFVNKN